MNIPTAKEFLDRNSDYVISPVDLKNDITDAMIEFAKIHVEQALKAAADTPNEVSGDTRTYDDCYLIIDSYPLNNIK